MFSKIQISSHGLLTTAKKQIPCLAILFFLAITTAEAQDTLLPVLAADTVQPPDLSLTTGQAADSLVTDSIRAEKKASRKNVLEAEVKYTADDSFRIKISEQKIYLYKNAKVEYQNINLESHYVEFDMNDNTVMAAGLKDTAGVLQGKPLFTQGEETFNSDTLMYNFKSRKGIIKYVKTKQGEGMLHSKQTKRLSDGEIHVKTGKYTTCDADHPHFYIALTKAIAIPKDKIISGPAYLVMEDIPLPLALPFGFFPNTSGRASGLIIPKWGNEKTRGYYLKDGGWYFVLNDYIDVTLLATGYTRGSWGANITTGYRKRYKFNGNFYAQYYRNTISDGNAEEKAGSKDYKIRWSHSQDAKANPSQSFSANVDFSTNSYEKNHSTTISDYTTNTKTSSISYRKSWPGRPFNFAASMNHSQNSQTGKVDLKLPTMTFNVNRLYPFRSKRSSGSMKWFQNIQISYSSKLDNYISSSDTMLFTKETLQKMKNGFSHSIPVSLTNIKLLKIINITPGLSYDGVLYTSHISKSIPDDSSYYFNFRPSQMVIDTIPGLAYAHALKPSIGISANPKIFARFTSKKKDSYFVALRHVISPTASFGFVPDISRIMPNNYYRTLVYPRTITQPTREEEYSVFQNGMYSTPALPGRSGSLSLGLSNNIEMKVRPKNDTTGKDKKVSILDNLNFSASYNPFLKEFKWSTIGMSGSTQIFNKKMNVTFGGTFDPYALDADGRRIDKSLFKEEGKLVRMTRAYVNTGFSLKSKAKGGSSPGRPEESLDDISTDRSPLETMEESPLAESAGYYYGDYVDFNVPWSLRVDYSWSYARTGRTNDFTHTVRLSGDISLTPKWKIGGNTGYDLVTRKMSVTNLNIHRDLHCWEMRFTVVPFGQRKSYSFTINAKTSILRDLKYDKRKSWYDNF